MFYYAKLFSFDAKTDKFFELLNKHNDFDSGEHPVESKTKFVIFYFIDCDETLNLLYECSFITHQRATIFIT